MGELLLHDGNGGLIVGLDAAELVKAVVEVVELAADAEVAGACGENHERVEVVAAHGEDDVGVFVRQIGLSFGERAQRSEIEVFALHDAVGLGLGHLPILHVQIDAAQEQVNGLLRGAVEQVLLVLRTAIQVRLGDGQVLEHLVIDVGHGGALKLKLDVGRQLDRHAGALGSVLGGVHVAVEVGQGEVILGAQEVGLALYAVVVGLFLLRVVGQVLYLVEDDVDDVDVLVEFVPRGGVVIDDGGVVVGAHFELPAKASVEVHDRLLPGLGHEVRLALALYFQVASGVCPLSLLEHRVKTLVTEASMRSDLNGVRLSCTGRKLYDSERLLRRR